MKFVLFFKRFGRDDGTDLRINFMKVCKEFD